MKKIILLLIAFMVLTPFSAVSVNAAPEMATVVNPETGERKAVDVGDPHAFDGGFILELFLFDEDALGYTVVTNYKTTVNVPMNITQDYVPVSSLTTKDGHTLTIDDVDRVFLVTEPGKRKEEIILCESLNSSTVRWTDCIRGLAFYGKSLASVQDNIKTHSSGSTVVMSNTHQVYDQFINKDDDQTIGGDKWLTGTTTFSKLPIATSTITPWDDKQLTPKKYVDDVGASGFTTSNASTTNGLETYGTFPETVGINASTTKGLSFDGDGALFIVASSTAGISVDSNGLYIDGSDDLLFSGDNTYSGISTFTGLVNGVTGVFGYGNGDDGATTTSATTTLDRDYYYTDLTVNSGVTLYTGGYRIFVTGTLTNNGTIDNSGGDGGNGSGTTGGAAGIVSGGGFFLSGENGEIGGTGASAGGVDGNNGNDGDNTSNTYLSSNGSAGGDSGNSATNAGATGGAGGISTQSDQQPKNYNELIVFRDFTPTTPVQLIPSAGSGSGAGGASATQEGGAGGGSGATGGTLLLAARTFINTGTISSDGGDGGNGAAASGNGGSGGGGAGGNGGIVILMYGLKTDTGTISVSGGSAGLGGVGGQNNGDDGEAGSDGEIIEITL